MQLHGLFKACLVHIHAALTGDITRDFQRHAESGVQNRGLFARENVLAAFLQIGQQVFQLGGRPVERALELLFFTGDGAQDGRAVASQLWESLAIPLNNPLSHLSHEGFVQADLAAETVGAADDHAHHVIAAQVARHHAIRHQKSRRAGVIGDHAIGRKVCLAFFISLAGELLGGLDQRPEQVGAVVRVDILQHRDDPLEAHARVYVRGGQRLQVGGVDAVVLNEHQVPKLQEAGAITVDAALVAGHVLLIAVLQAAIYVHLAARAAGAYLGHFPEIILAPKEKHVAGIHAGLGAPGIGRLVILWNIALVITKTGCPQLIFGQTPHVR